VRAGTSNIRGEGSPGWLQQRDCLDIRGACMSLSSRCFTSACALAVLQHRNSFADFAVYPFVKFYCSSSRIRFEFKRGDCTLVPLKWQDAACMHACARACESRVNTLNKIFSTAIELEDTCRPSSNRDIAAASCNTNAVDAFENTRFSAARYSIPHYY
jgi:hypothetical protein